MKRTPVRSSTAGADNRFEMIVSPLTVKLEDALTRSPARKSVIAACNAAALPTATVRRGAKEGRAPT
jgi:hypothetical protein